MMARRIRLFGLAILAMAALPPSMFPAPWLVAIALPSTLLAFLRVRSVPAYLAYPLALSAQFAVLPLAYILTEGGLEPLALLGVTLVPPLMLSAVRADAPDTHRTLFLAFCSVLIGSILGEPPSVLVGSFAALGITILHAEQSVQPVRRVSRQQPHDGRALRGLAYGLVGVVATVGTLEVLQAVSVAPRGGNTGSRVGIDGTFELESGSNTPLDFYSDEILRVSAPQPRGMRRPPTALYLRSHAFEIAKKAAWDRRPTPRVPAPSDPWPVQPSNDAAGVELSIELAQPFEAFAYVPTNAITLANTEGLIGDAREGRFEYESVPPDGSFLRARIEFSREPRTFDEPRLDDPQLLQVPEFYEANRQYFDSILEHPNVRRARATGNALRFADSISRRLGLTHRYDRKTPEGPYQEVLLNFLKGSRSGYCMHFAMTTALCLRLSGVPARLAVGLYGGEELGDGFVRTFGSRHAHAWVEIPYENSGWIVVDPTPPAARANTSEPLMPDEDTPYAEGLQARAEEQDGGDKSPSFDRMALWAAGVGAGVFLVTVIVAWSRRRRRAPGRRQSVAPSAPKLGREPRQRLLQLIQKIQRAGCPRRPLETLDAFAGRAIAAGVAGPELHDAFRAYDEVRFGGREWNDDRRQRMQRIEIRRADENQPR